MKKFAITKTKVVLGVAVLLSAVLLISHRAQFMAGGAMVNIGYRMQDHLHDFDFDDDNITAKEVWDEVEHQNELSYEVRRRFPRTSYHPLVAMVVCMDARIDTAELTGDTRRYYYIIRTAGSVISEREEEMLELAVANGVKVILFTTHSDCAAEKVAGDPALSLQYPQLTAAVREREARFQELLARPAIAAKVASGELVVKRMSIDTATDHLEAPGTLHAHGAPAAEGGH